MPYRRLPYKLVQRLISRRKGQKNSRVQIAVIRFDTAKNIWVILPRRSTLRMLQVPSASSLRLRKPGLQPRFDKDQVGAVSKHLALVGSSLRLATRRSAAPHRPLGARGGFFRWSHWPGLSSSFALGIPCEEFNRTNRETSSGCPAQIATSSTKPRGRHCHRIFCTRRIFGCSHAKHGTGQRPLLPAMPTHPPSIILLRILAAAASEGFINELAELCTPKRPDSHLPAALIECGRSLQELEQTRAPTLCKYSYRRVHPLRRQIRQREGSSITILCFYLRFAIL